MSEISRIALFGKLNPIAYGAIEGATVFCKMRGNPYVELEHWFAQLLQSQDSDLHRAIQHYGLDISVIAKDMAPTSGAWRHGEIRGLGGQVRLHQRAESSGCR